MEEATSAGEISFRSGVEDLKLLLLRFAEGKSFSSESGGGGAESNIQLVPSLLLLPLYLLNQARLHPAQVPCFEKPTCYSSPDRTMLQDKLMKTFLAAPATTWVPSSFVVEGPLYYTTAALLLLPPAVWQRSPFPSRLLTVS